MVDADGLFGYADQSTGVCHTPGRALSQTHIKQEFHVTAVANGA